MLQTKVGQAPVRLKTVFSVCGRATRKPVVSFPYGLHVWVSSSVSILSVLKQVLYSKKMWVFPGSNLHSDICSYPELKIELYKWIQTNWIRGNKCFTVRTS